MNDTLDLAIEKDILSLFDHTNNGFASAAVRDLLTQHSSSLALAEERQNILSELAKQSSKLKISYSASDFNQVHYFCCNLGNDNSDGLSQFESRFLGSSKKDQQRKAAMIQLLFLLDSINTGLLSKLELENFTVPFKELVTALSTTIEKFLLVKHISEVRNSKFKQEQATKLYQLLSDLNANGELGKFWNNFFLLEAYVSIAKGIQKHQFRFPKLGAEKFEIEEFFHPLVKNVVTNSISMRGNLLVLTGPNMSGKSTLLKSIAICVYLARAGFAIPASAASIPFFDQIVAAIHHSDDLRNGYSHFMTELKKLKSVVVSARESKKCFAVFDELFRGTNPEEAAEITITTLKGLAVYKHCTFIISSHLQELSALSQNSTGIEFGFIDTKLENGNPVFSYKLKPGWSDLKLGKILFEKEGLNKLLDS